MKKLLVVFVALFVVALGVPALAVDADWTGEFTFGGITAFSEDDITNAYGNLYFDSALGVDDYNTVVIRFAGGFGNAASYDAGPPAVTAQDVNAWTVGEAYLKTDMGEALGLPVGLVTKGGFASIWSRKYEVTGHAYERTLVRSNIAGHGFVFSVDAGMLTVDAGVNFELGPDTQDYAVMVTVPDIAGMASAEAGYFIADNDDFEGRFIVNAKAEGIADMIGVAAGFCLDRTATGTAPGWFWGAGVKADVSMLGIGVSLNGKEEAFAHELGVDVNVGITDDFGIDLGLGLGLSDELDTFRGFEPSVYYNMGAASWRAGYLYSADFVKAVPDDPTTPLVDETVAQSGYLYTAPALAPGGGSGFFIKCDIDI